MNYGYSQKNVFGKMTFRKVTNDNNRMATTVVSIDVGIVNLAFCKSYVKDEKCVIMDWRKFDLTTGDNTTTAETCSARCVALFAQLFDGLPDNHNTYVVIERQMPQNIQCMCIGHACFAFFLTKFRDVNVTFINANSKSLETSGKARKGESVKVARKFLEDNHYQYWLDKFNAEKKKDDLADSLLQIISNPRLFKYKPIEIPVIVIDD